MCVVTNEGVGPQYAIPFNEGKGKSWCTENHGIVILAVTKRRSLPDSEVTGDATAVAEEPEFVNIGKCAVTSRAFQVGDLLLKGEWEGEGQNYRSMHTMQVGKADHVEPCSPLRYLNHSCKASTGLVIDEPAREMMLYALNDLAEGEEITLDYDTFEAATVFMPELCLCGQDNCRKSISGYGYMPEADRLRYLPKYVAKHLLN